MGLLEQQREERKSRIMDAVRRLITEHGYQGVTIRELARESRVSVPTLYKLFGGKYDLLFAAVASDFSGLLAAVSERGAASGLARVFSLIEVQCANLERTPRYSRILLSAFFGADPQAHELNETIGRTLRRALTIALREMQGDGQLAEWVEPNILAQRVASQCFITTLSWATEHLSDEALCPTMMYGVCLLLLGVARGGALPEIEKRARESQVQAVWHAAPSARRAAS